MFERLVLSWWNGLGRVRQHGLLREGVSLKAGFEVSKCVIPSVSFSAVLRCK